MTIPLGLQPRVAATNSKDEHKDGGARYMHNIVTNKHSRAQTDLPAQEEGLRVAVI